MGRNVTADAEEGRYDPAQRFRIYCRTHEGDLQLLATCGSPEALGVAIVTMGREGEFTDCALGVLDVLGEEGQRWVLRPWEKSAKNVSQAASDLARSKKKSDTR